MVRGGGAVVPVLTVVVQLLSLALLVMAVVGAYRRLRADRGPADGPVAEPVPRPALSPDAVAAEQAWRRARAEFQRLRGEFAAHEADPLAVLRRPALSDTTVAATARFVDAFAEAQALDTDGYPGEPHAATHVRAGDAARRADRRGGRRRPDPARRAGPRGAAHRRARGEAADHGAGLRLRTRTARRLRPRPRRAGPPRAVRAGAPAPPGPRPARRRGPR
ncbi:Basic proline-rich protein precursor [Pseudonocardia sp. Ae505_Ps2]|nr:Basic proline-rich protein precursor [Pseudonocardia sp. Ae505_Ps2]